MAYEDLTGVTPAVPVGTMGDALDAGLRQANGQTEIDEKLATEVKKLACEYKGARAFDAPTRKKYAADRSYANGTALKAFYSSANLIASFIDILVSFLYAKNPDVSVRPAKQVVVPQDPPPVAPPGVPGMPGAPVLPGAPPLPGAAPLIGAPPVVPPVESAAPVGAIAPPAPGGLGDALAGGVPPVAPPMALPAPVIPGGAPMADTGDMDSKDRNSFSQTMGIVIPRLWKDANLKKTAKKMVRSALTVGAGWCKAVMFSEEGENPQVAAQLRTKQTMLQALKAKQAAAADAGTPPDDNYDTAVTDLENAMKGLELRKLRTRQGMHIDHVRTEDIQVSLDVADTADYLDANWIAQDLYVSKCDIATRFQNPDGTPIFSDEDLRKATVYYQRPTTGAAEDGDSKDTGGAFTKQQPASAITDSSGEKPVEFVKIVELWDKRDGLVKTFIEGIDTKWAVDPYPPQQASTRFYPFFRNAFYEVDGNRHPDSLVGRIDRLQNEYSGTRSGGRKAKERQIGATVFVRGQLSPEDAAKLQNSDYAELIGIQPTNPDLPIDKVIAAKPMSTYDPRVFDTAPVQGDMEKISGVQEALQSSVTQPKTATEANIQQTGFSARTNADRDSEEDTLNDLALYTAETAIQEVSVETVQKMAGMQSFWPFGMDIEDIFTMLSIEIDAGTTGKPKADQERQAWATILPLLTRMITQIRQVEATDPPLAQALRNLLAETVRRLDDRLDIEQFLAIGHPPPPMLTPPGDAGSPQGGADNIPQLGSQPGSAGVPPPSP